MDFVRGIMEWVNSHEVLVGSIVTASAVVFLGTLFAVPWALVRIPTRYFQRDREQRVPVATMHPLLRAIWLILKNLLGWVFVILGVAMLVLPGQGLMTILIGMLLIDFPGKYKAERYLVSRKPVLQSINWLRERADRPPLQLD